MPSHESKNKIVVASAGSRKTSSIVQEALSRPDMRVLLTTYTNENVEQITDYIIKIAGHVPKHITVISWYSFLLQDGVRPYQNHMTDGARISTVDFVSEPPRFARKAEVDKYYLTHSGNIYRDRVSDFVCSCNECSGGLPVKRLEKIYDAIFIDEMQDFAGYDLDFVEILCASKIKVTGVADPRQGTFSTNNSSKNKKYKRTGIAEWVAAKGKEGVFSIEVRNECYRSNQTICDFADALFPDQPKTISRNTDNTGHDGIFKIKRDDVAGYVSQYQPMILRWNIATDTDGLRALNIGMTKGRTYERVLIFATKPMKKYLETYNLAEAGDLTKLYVAVTRAKHSAAFVV